MEKFFVTPRFPPSATWFLLLIVLIELAIYGFTSALPSVWFVLAFGGFYLTYLALFRRDTLPLVFTVLFLTTHHSLLFHYNRDLPIALLFTLIFIANSLIMWFLLHYGTHLKREYHTAYSVISGFMIAELITLFASMARDWSFRFEVAAYIPTVFSYIFWRFACLSAEAILSWKQFMRLAILIIVLMLVIIFGSPPIQV